MTTPPLGVERRIGQRFAFNLPVFLRDVATAVEGPGFTQDLSSRGAFLFTDLALSEGAEIELTLKMPSEITLGENMRVRCRGRVLRIVRPADTSWKPAASADSAAKLAEIKAAETKIGVAVCLKRYEYLPEVEDSSADFRRISALHSPARPSVPLRRRPPRQRPPFPAQRPASLDSPFSCRAVKGIALATWVAGNGSQEIVRRKIPV